MLRSLNLDQVRIFLSVFEEGSFSAAARKLGRAQSAVTYAIQELEADLKVVLFDRSAYRPELTGAGRALLPRAKRLLNEAGALQLQAEGMGSGLEPEITIVVDSMFPMCELIGAFSEFEERFPSVTTHLHVEALGTPIDMVLEGTAELGLVIASFAEFDLVEKRHAGWVNLVPVCAPTHPLALAQARTDGLLPESDVVDHLQLVLSNRFKDKTGRDHGVSAVRTWRLADLCAKRAMLTAGIGWGSLPHHMITADLAEGRLIELRLEHWSGTGSLPRLELLAVKKSSRALGPAASWLLARLSKTS